MRTRYRKILVAATAALASMAIVTSAAEATTPAAPYQDFAGCPTHAENPFAAECIKFTFSGGHIGFGNREVPVTNPIVLRGAYEQISGNFVYNAEGGIVPAKQTVPGGLIGMTGLSWLDEFLGSKEALKLYATVESAGQPGSVYEESLLVPVKIHLQNPALGSGCYVGSNASPIDLNLAISEAAGELAPEVGRESVLTSSAPGQRVDSGYSVPGATGCSLTIGSKSISINSLVDAAYALPSASNETVLGYTFSLVEQSVIYP